MEREVVRVLSIDGGGIRGIAAAQMISALDAQLKALGGGGVLDTFDVFAGTSTGSIIAAGLAAADLLGREDDFPKGLVSLYRDNAEKIFGNSRPLDGLFTPKHPSDGLHEVLASELQGVRLRDLRKGFLATYYQIRSTSDDYAPEPRAVVVKAGRLATAASSDTADLLLHDVVQSSASAPTYFDPTTVGVAKNIDGGIFANNPSALAYAAARRLAPQVQLVSIGCGSSHTPSYNTHVDEWGAWEWISFRNGTPLLDAMMRAQSDNVDALMSDFAASGDNLSYHRFQFELPECHDGIYFPDHGMNSPDKRYLKALVDLATSRMQAPDAAKVAGLLRQNAPWPVIEKQAAPSGPASSQTRKREKREDARRRRACRAAAA